MNPKSPIMLALCAVLVAGCASPVVKEAQRLLAEDKYPEAIARFEQAVREDPDDLETRQAYHRQRDLALARLVTRAEVARSGGRRDLAETAWRDVLRIDAANPRARNGLAQIEHDRRLETLVAQADKLMREGQFAAADAVLHGVLVERPDHPEARRGLKALADRLPPAPPAASEIKSALGKRATFEFQDAPLKSVFDFIARSSGINFIFDKDVKTDAKTTLHARDTNLEDFIRLLLVTNQLERKVLNDNSVLVYPNTPGKQRDFQELVSRTFFLANADARQTMTMLKTLVKTKDIYVDEKLNLLIMKDTPEAVRYAEQLVALQDVAEPEVMLEVEVLEVTRGRLSEIGLKFPDSATASLGNEGRFTLTEWRNRGSDFVGLTVSDPALALSLKSSDSDTNLLANPRIRVRNREKAKIHIGDKVPVITSTAVASAGVSTSVNYLDVGLKLDVEPQIHLDDEVAIKVGLEVSSITQKFEGIAGVLAYAVGTRTAATTLRIRDGETQVLAGLIQDDDRRNAAKVPGLGDLPILGRLFANHSDDKKKTEAVLLITPRILRNLPRPGREALLFPVGTESNIGGRPLAIEATAPRALAVSTTGGGRTPTTPASEPAGEPTVEPLPSARPAVPAVEAGAGPGASPPLPDPARPSAGERAGERGAVR